MWLNYKKPLPLTNIDQEYYKPTTRSKERMSTSYISFIVFLILSFSFEASATVSEANAFLKWKSTFTNQTSSSKLSTWVNPNTGSFCTSFKEMKALQNINISHNNLEGPIQDIAWHFAMLL